MSQEVPTPTLNNETNFAYITTPVLFNTKYKDKLAPYNYIFEYGDGDNRISYLLTMEKDQNNGTIPTYKRLSIDRGYVDIIGYGFIDDTGFDFNKYTITKRYIHDGEDGTEPLIQFHKNMENELSTYNYILTQMNINNQEEEEGPESNLLLSRNDEKTFIGTVKGKYPAYYYITKNEKGEWIKGPQQFNFDINFKMLYAVKYYYNEKTKQRIPIVNNKKPPAIAEYYYDQTYKIKIPIAKSGGKRKTRRNRKNKTRKQRRNRKSRRSSRK